MALRILKIGLVAAMVAIPLGSGAGSAGAVGGFGDVADGRYFTEPVQWMVDNDITGGVSPTCFATSRATTRGEAAAFIWRMEGRPDPGPTHHFTDVAQSWQQDPVSWMADNGITSGTTPTSFEPDRAVTRGEFATFVYRLAREPDPGPAHDFADVADGRYFADAVQWMANEGITQGTSPTTFSPERPLTRGEAATFLYRYNDEPTVAVDPTTPYCLPWHRGPANSTPADAAQDFIDFTGLTDPTLSEFRQGDARSGEIEITTTAPGGPNLTTTVFVRLDSSDRWVVIGAASEAIDIIAPTPDATVTSPMLTLFNHRNWARTVLEVWVDGADTPAGGADTSPGLVPTVVDLSPGTSGPATVIYRSVNAFPLTGTLAVSTQRVEIAP